jgi:transcriptional regulator with XRE-family HTH domain
LTPLQLKLARTALGLGVRELAKLAGAAPSTITRFESGKGGMQTGTVERLQRVFEEGGVAFIDADAAGGPGVRMKK